MHSSRQLQYRELLLNKQRKVKDPIYGTIYFNHLIWKFIDTPHLQKLRNIKQLGCLEYVFPCATHTRFEHSLGTAHLARNFIEHIIKNNRQKYKDSEIQSAKKTVTLAGLLHDIGHGPFGHIFDRQVVTQIKQQSDQKARKWSHVLGSELLIRDLMKSQDLKQLLTLDEVQRIIELIKGVPKGERKWELQIINNRQNGIDVNKLDYFRRDAFYLRAKNIFINNQLIMSQARIIDDDICYPTKYSQDVFNIFHSRYKLFKNYHFNVVNKGIQIMISDVLNLIKDKFQFQNKCNNIEKDAMQFIGLTDDIVENVQDTLQNMKYSQQAKKLQQQIKKFEQASIILKRIKTRDLYRFVKQLKYYVLERQDAQVVNMFQKELKKQKIIKEISQDIADINPKAICVTINDVGFGIQQFNPMKKVGFFRKEEQPHSKLNQRQTQKLSLFRPSAHIERSIKIYVKQNQYKLYLRVDSAFSQFRQKFNRKCQYKLKKQSGLFHIFEGSGGKKPKNPKLVKGPEPPQTTSQRKESESESENKNKNKKFDENQAIKRKINDPIHGLIYFDSFIWQFIDTTEFQRLRKMKQLQSLQYAFPCATHNRYEHSIGNAYLAKRFIENLIQNNSESYKLPQNFSSVKTITLAALLRDIGHAPFNDILERSLLKNLQIKQKGKQQKQLKIWKTSQASAIIFKYMISKYPELKKQLNDEQISRVQDLIKGNYKNQLIWQFEIINNRRNGIDVSLFQSLRRDSFFLNTKYIYIDHNLLMKQAKIIDNKISYPTKYVQTVYYIFQSMYKLRKNYYYEPTSVSVQLMISDIFKNVQGKFKIRQKCQNIAEKPEQFLDLNDQIIENIEYMYSTIKQNQLKPSFLEAVKLLDRLKRMNFYTFVKEIKYQQNEVVQSLEQKLAYDQVRNKIQLSIQGQKIDFEIDISDVGFGLQGSEEHVMKKVDFFRKEDADLKARFTKVAENQIQELSMLYTDAYIERSIKVFITNQNQDQLQHFIKLKTAVIKVCSQIQSSAVNPGETGNSPGKKRKEIQIIQPVDPPPLQI